LISNSRPQPAIAGRRVVILVVLAWYYLDEPFVCSSGVLLLFATFSSI